MENRETLMKITFEHSNDNYEAPLTKLVATLSGFLDQMATEALVGKEFASLIGSGPGKERFEHLLDICAFPNQPEFFFDNLLAQLAKADGTKKIAINNIKMPHLLLMSILEIMLPGEKLITIRNVEQLEQAANIAVAESDRKSMQEVIDTYPVRLSMHTIRQMRVSRDVAYQYLPFVEELDQVGHTNTWIGQFHQGLLEQMYQNRVIFLLNMSCPVYCRFCFRKHKESRNEANPTPDDVNRAVEHVKNSPSIKEIVITGGDPFMNHNNIAAAIDGLLEIDHVQTLRLATRSIAYYPNLFLKDDARLLNYLKQKNLQLQECGKRMEIATHFIHPDEVSPQCLMIISELVNSGISVYIQTPFLNDCNDSGPELVRLFSLLRGAGAELHYIYIPCSPIHGNSVYWSPLSGGIQAGNYLRAHLSDRVVPRICTATPIGKMDWNSSGWAVEPVKDNNNFIWIRSPYTPEYFKEFAPLANKLDNIRVNDEGTIDIQYMAKIGDPSLFLGSRPPKKTCGSEQQQDIKVAFKKVHEYERLYPSIADTGSDTISRVHLTRVELDINCTESDFSYITNNDSITDVIVISDNDIIKSLNKVAAIAKRLDDIPHINSLRLRSLSFNYKPHLYTAAAIDLLAGLNKITLANPLRLEIETQFLLEDEITDTHARLVRKLKNKGITVYSNTPLLGSINDTPEAIHKLAYRCRTSGIEFHHLYCAGSLMQDVWNLANPLPLYDIVDIATKVRREGSGREVPRYIIRTVLGDVDFGLSSVVEGQKSNLCVTLLPYDISYFRKISPQFNWPQGVEKDQNGHPVVPVSGLLKTTDFTLS